MKTRCLNRRLSQALLATLLVPVSLVRGQTTATPSSPETTPDGVTVMEKFTVKGVADENQIMPTVRPISSVMGDARSILDTPRSVSSINKELMEQVRIKSVTDFSQFAPGVYTAARYGLATTPMVRGDLAELYLNGQRAKYSRDSVMPSFNGIEALDIVKGPGSAVYGPQSNGAAGYTNFVMKQPYFDKQHTEVSLSYAGVTTDHSYSNLEWQLDNGGPLSKDTAYRFSYLGRDGDTYYQNTKDNTQDIYATLAHRFGEGFTLNWWVQAYKQTYGEVSGINRPTQALIDSAKYLAGTSSYNAATNTYTINNARLVDIEAYKSVVGTADIAHAKREQTQLILNKKFSGDFFIKNLTYLENRTSDKYEPSIVYSEYVKTDWNIQNRTEAHLTFDTGSLANSIIAGVDFKRERLISYQSFFAEDYNFQDLTLDSSVWSRAGTNIYLFGVPGHTKFGTDIGYGNTSGSQDSLITDLAAFYQHDIKLTKQLSFIAGGRVDHLVANAKSAAFVDLGGYGGNGTLYPAGNRYNQSANVNDVSYFLSGVYKVTDSSSLYVTYNRVNALLGSANFGGVSVSANTKPALLSAMKSLAVLSEAGYKFVLLDNRLYNTVSAYRQVRSDPDRFGNVADRIARGVEFESVYQASKNLSILGNFSYQDVFRNGQTGVFQSNADYYKLQANGTYTAPGGGNSAVPYKRRYSGVPNWLTSGRINYRMDNGFGFGVGPQITGKQKANAEGTLHIPVQYKINGTLFYSTKMYDFQLNVDNITDQNNFTVGDPDFTGNTVIYMEKPLSVSFTARYRF